MQDQDIKADAGKLQIRMVPPQIVRDIAVIREYGNRKYNDQHSWRRVEVDRYVDALLRHTLDFIEDYYSVDEESGHYHYQHMACNMAFLCELLKEGNKNDRD